MGYDGEHMLIMVRINPNHAAIVIPKTSGALIISHYLGRIQRCRLATQPGRSACSSAP